jgi:hypothetical protein
MPASELVQLDLGAFAGEAYPDGTYGRALLVGLELDALLGWDAVRALARPGSAAQCMDLDAWLDTLAPEDAERARAVVGLGP